MKDRQRERKKERKKERKSIETSTVTKVVIKNMYITLNTTFTSTCYILTNKCCTWLRMTRNINRRNLQGKRGGKRERKTDREKERQKERKKERKYWDKTVTKMVIKYMYIKLNTTFTSTCYIHTNKCCTWLRMTRHINRRNLQEKRKATERNKDRQRERKKERKKVRKVSDRDGNYIHVHYTKDYIYKYMLHTYQQVLHLIENDEAYK